MSIRSANSADSLRRQFLNWRSAIRLNAVGITQLVVPATQHHPYFAGIKLNALVNGMELPPPKPIPFPTMTQHIVFPPLALNRIRPACGLPCLGSHDPIVSFLRAV